MYGSELNVEGGNSSPLSFVLIMVICVDYIWKQDWNVIPSVLYMI